MFKSKIESDILVKLRKIWVTPHQKLKFTWEGM
jgi:hypothetical protein